MLALTAGPLRARIYPEVGGIIAGLDWRGPDGRLQAAAFARRRGALDGGAEHDGQLGDGAFANRAFDGIVDDGTTRFSVPENNPRGGGNIHGFGWQSAWAILGHTAGHTVLEHRRSEGPDPYRYRVRQEISLDDAGMTIALAITNEADQALPYGIGHHPWFPCAADTRLGMTASGALVFGEAFRATGAQPLADGGPYGGNPVFATGRETAWSFLGWDGTARIETPSTGLAIVLTASESLRCPVVWAPAGAEFLCIEPQSHAIGSPSEAPARQAAPLRRLQPGEALEGWLRIAPEAL